MADLYHYTNPGLVDPSGVTDLPGRPSKAGDGKGAMAPISPEYIPTAAPGIQYAEQMDLSRDEMTLPELVQASMRENNLLYMMADKIQSATFDPVPGYDYTQDKDILAGIPDEYATPIKEATSPSEAAFWRGKILQSLDDKQRIELEGWTGTAAAVAASLADPLAFIGGAGVMKAGVAATRLTQGTKTAGAIAGMVAGAGEGYAYTEAGIESGRMTAEDQIIGIAAGAATGMLAGVITPKAVTNVVKGTPDEVVTAASTVSRKQEQALKTAADDIAKTPASDDIKSINTDLPEPAPIVVAERAYEVLAQNSPSVSKLSRKEQKQLAAMKAKGIPIPKDMQDRINAHKSVGAAATAGRPVATKDDFLTTPTESALDFRTDIMEHEATFGAGIQKKMGNMLKLNQAKWVTSQARRFLTGQNAGARYFAAHFLENASGAVNNRTAAIMRQTLSNQLDSNLRDVYDAQRLHFKELGRLDNTSAKVRKRLTGEYEENFNRALRTELSEMTTAAHNGVPHVSRAPDYIQKAAAAWQKSMDDALDHMERYGLVDDAAALRKKRGYVPLHWNSGKILKLARDPARLKRAKALLGQSYEKMGIPADIAVRISNRVFERALSPIAQVDANLVGLFDASATGQLRELLSEAGVDESAIGNLLRQIDDRFNKSGTAGFTKYRTTVDLNMSDGDISLLDLIDNDMPTLFRKYTSEVSGRVAMASKGIRSDADWAAMRQAILDEEAMIGGDSIALGHELDGIKDAFMGRGRNGGINRNAARLMEATRMATMGQMGFPQLIEMGQLMGHHGVLAVMKAIPATVGLMRDAKKGIHSPLMQDLEALLGPVWDDHLLHRPGVRLDRQLGNDGKIMEGVDRALAHGQHYLGYISGMHHILSMQRRMGVTMEAGSIAKLALSGDITKRARMEAMGFDFSAGGNWEGIQRNIKQHAVFDSRGTLQELNLSKWDAVSADDFGTILSRSVNQTIQGQFIGETPSVLHSTTGALLTQFRTFPLVAKEKQLQRQLSIGDSESFYTALTTFAMGALVAPVRMSINGQSDDITPEAVAAQAIQYMPMMTLAPDVAGLGAALGVLPDAAYHRNWMTDKADHPDVLDILTPPGVQFLGRAGKALTTTGKAVSPWDEQYDMTASDMRAMKGVTPFGNTIFASALFNSIIEDAE